MNLEQKVTAWDGKSATTIAELFQACQHEANFIKTVIKLLKPTAAQKGATWLLKAWLEKGNKLTNKQATAFFSSLNHLQHWESKLHALQCLPFISIAKENKKIIETFLRKTLTDDNKFIRAWSYNGFYELSQQHPEYKDETRQLFTMAMRDEAPSVKARIRNLTKKGFK